MIVTETIKKNIPKPVKNYLKKYLRVGPYPNWKALVNSESELWPSALSAQKTSKILIATSVGSHRSGNITESMLAAALTLRGADIHVLLCDNFLPACLQCQYQEIKNVAKFAEKGPQTTGLCTACFAPAARMYNDLGITSHLYGRCISEDEKSLADKITKQTPPEQIEAYKYNNYNIGEHARAGALRFFCTGDLENQPFADQIYKRYFKSALLTMFAVQRLIEKHKYGCLVFFHGIYIPHGVIGEVARQKSCRVVNWNTAYRQKRFIFTHSDTYHHTLQYEPVDNWENMPWSDEMEKQTMDYLTSREAGTRDWQQFNENANSSLEAAKRELDIDFSKPIIGLLPNVVWDAQLHYRTNAFKNLIEWTIETIRYFIKRSDLQLLIRIHPAEIKRYSKSRQPLIGEINKVFDKLPDNIFIVPPESKISTYTIMEQCNTVLIYGTKTGVELTARGIPVIVAGEAWVRNKGLTMDASSPEEYFDLLEKLPLKEKMSYEQITRARKYAYHFFYRRGIYLPFMSKTNDSMAFTLNINNLNQLLPGRSVGLDVICDGIIHGTEFIYPAELQREPDE